MKWNQMNIKWWNKWVAKKVKMIIIKQITLSISCIDFEWCNSNFNTSSHMGYNMEIIVMWNLFFINLYCLERNVVCLKPISSTFKYDTYYGWKSFILLVHVSCMFYMHDIHNMSNLWNCFSTQSLLPNCGPRNLWWYSRPTFFKKTSKMIISHYNN